MQVFVTRTNQGALVIESDHPEQLTVACLEIGGALKMQLKLHVSEMEIGKTMLIDTRAAHSK